MSFAQVFTHGMSAVIHDMSAVNVLQLFPCQPEWCVMQSDVKKAVDAKAYPRVSADIRHQLGTLK